MEVNAELLRSKMRDEMNTIADHVSTGSCHDWASYMKQTGVIEGLAKAERMLLDILEDMKRAEEGDEA